MSRKISGIRKRRDTGKFQASVETPKGRRRKDFDTQLEAANWRASMEAKKKTGGFATGEDTVHGFIDSWLEQKALQKKAVTTLRGYRDMMGHIKKHLPNMPLADLTPNHMRQLHTALAENGASPYLIHRLHSYFSMCLRDAMRSEKLLRNVANLYAPPKPRPQPKTRWDSDEAAKVLQWTKEHMPYRYPYFLLALATGMRRGELLGLRWSDCEISENSGLIRIRQAVTFPRGGMRFGPTKTPKSKRTNPIDAAVCEALRWQKLQNIKIQAGATWPGYDLVFCNSRGNPVDPTTLRRDMDRITAGAGVRRIRLYDTRSTFTSEASKHVEARRLADLIGNSDPAHMQRIYIRPFSDELITASVPSSQLYKSSVPTSAENSDMTDKQREPTQTEPGDTPEKVET